MRGSEQGGYFLDVSGWSRRAQFEFFLRYEQPFFNICAEVEVGETLRWCRARGRSSSLACWYLCQRAINEVAPMRYRLRGERVWVHDRIRVATTMLNGDETFRFCYLPYGESFEAFESGAQEVMRGEVSGEMDDRREDDAVIHGSTLPWVRFTSVSHARRCAQGDAVPKVVFGRYAEEADERVKMPVSLEVHHAMMDGLHASQFFERLSEGLASPKRFLA